jgi:hypothetical protein
VRLRRAHQQPTRRALAAISDARKQSHPHAGGENEARAIGTHFGYGPSPRGWGKRALGRVEFSTFGPSPRGGENNRWNAEGLHRGGPSPRGWGKHRNSCGRPSTRLPDSFVACQQVKAVLTRGRAKTVSGSNRLPCLRRGEPLTSKQRCGYGCETLSFRRAGLAST